MSKLVLRHRKGCGNTMRVNSSNVCVSTVVENVLEYGSHKLQGHQVSVRKLSAEEIKVDEDESPTQPPTCHRWRQRYSSGRTES